MTYLSVNASSFSLNLIKYLLGTIIIVIVIKITIVFHSEINGFST